MLEDYFTFRWDLTLEMSWNICREFTGRLDRSYSQRFNVKGLKRFLKFYG